MIVAGIQLDIVWEDPRANLAQADAAIARAAEEGARLVALPEMFATGFSMNAAACCAAAPEVLAFLGAAARRHEVGLVAGVALESGGSARNACVVLDATGAEAARYVKLHPFSLADEGAHYAAGDALASVTLEGVRVTPLVCYDLRFPEPFRARADATDLFVVVANWPERRGDAWRTLVKARAIENQAFVLGVNRHGVDGAGVAHAGDSMLVDPLGAVRTRLSDRAGIVLAEVDPAVVADVRHRFRFLADRRPELYRTWNRG